MKFLVFIKVLFLILTLASCMPSAKTKSKDKEISRISTEEALRRKMDSKDYKGTIREGDKRIKAGTASDEVKTLYVEALLQELNINTTDFKDAILNNLKSEELSSSETFFANLDLIKHSDENTLGEITKSISLLESVENKSEKNLNDIASLLTYKLFSILSIERKNLEILQEATAESIFTDSEHREALLNLSKSIDKDELSSMLDKVFSSYSSIGETHKVEAEKIENQIITAMDTKGLKIKLIGNLESFGSLLINIVQNNSSIVIKLINALKITIDESGIEAEVKDAFSQVDLKNEKAVQRVTRLVEDAINYSRRIDSSVSIEKIISKELLNVLIDDLTNAARNNNVDDLTDTYKSKKEELKDLLETIKLITSSETEYEKGIKSTSDNVKDYLGYSEENIEEEIPAIETDKIAEESPAEEKVVSLKGSLEEITNQIDCEEGTSRMNFLTGNSNPELWNSDSVPTFLNDYFVGKTSDGEIIAIQESSLKRVLISGCVKTAPFQRHFTRFSKNAKKIKNSESIEFGSTECREKSILSGRVELEDFDGNIQEVYISPICEYQFVNRRIGTRFLLTVSIT